MEIIHEFETTVKAGGERISQGRVEEDKSRQLERG